jgi:hypothetical protein
MMVAGVQTQGSGAPLEWRVKKGPSSHPIPLIGVTILGGKIQQGISKAFQLGPAQGLRGREWTNFSSGWASGAAQKALDRNRLTPTAIPLFRWFVGSLIAALVIVGMFILLVSQKP